MSNEITVFGNHTVYNPTVMDQPDIFNFSPAFFTMTGTLISKGTLLATTGGVTIPFNGITAPHRSVFHNLDATNYVQIVDIVSSCNIARLYPGEWAIIPLDQGVTLKAKANTASCQLVYAVYSY